MDMTRSLLRQGTLRRSKSRNQLKAKPSRSLFVGLSQRIRQATVPLVLISIGILLSVYGFPWLRQQINHPIKRVVVEGDLQYLQRRELIDMVPVYQSDHWLDISLAHIQQILEQAPWVYSAQVTREWPSSLRIHIQEQVPIARWNDSQVLNQYGQVFERDNKALQALPLLTGDAGSEANVMKRFLEFSQMVAPLYRRIVKLELDERLSWRVTLDNGVLVEVGSTDAMSRMRRFVRLYREVLASRADEVVSVDLRYTSGAAVRYKKT